MGGRRSRSIYDLVNKTKDTIGKINDLKKSIISQDVNGTVVTSGSILADANDLAKSIIYSKILYSEIEDNYKKKKVRKEELLKEIKKEWALYKRNNDITISQAAEENIVLSIAATIWETMKNE